MNARRWIAMVFVAMLVVLGSALLVAPQMQERRLMREAEGLRESLEGYRAQYGQYPDSLAPLGIVERMEGPLYYRRESESSYQLWFGTQLGESRVFSSKEGAWR